MIWVRGEIVSDQALQISVLDRALEHGLGLFETFRTWNGHATLLPRHIERMLRSASELGLPLERGQLPDSRDIALLIAATERARPSGQDVRLRLTLSGGIGTSPAVGSVLWMSVGHLPPPLEPKGAVITRSMEVAEDDSLARHKTLNYWRKRIGYEQALAAGSDDVLCLDPGRMILEASRANVFLVEGQRLCTPGADAPLLSGIMRQVVLERAARLGIEVEEGPLPLGRVASTDEAFLTSSVRGMLPIARLMDAELPAPGPVTRQLWNDILPWLESGGTPP
jgi:branched-subunit amino acid aminotransferase/4-amino-4-deoxychorismate lyase